MAKTILITVAVLAVLPIGHKESNDRDQSEVSSSQSLTGNMSLDSDKPVQIAASAKSRDTVVGPPRGKLLIVGGRSTEQIWSFFLELVGGPNAPIVVIPTAQERVDREKLKAIGMLRTLGATNVTILHTRDPNVADTEEFVKPLRKAAGAWLVGGRQWRLTDAYLNTLTHKELSALLERGGIIAGTSAGASVQASYMVRGAPEGPEIMMAKGHEEGFGFMRGVAIDQHVIARNRLDDLPIVLKAHPELLAIGIDEATAIVVEGDWFEVIGDSKVAIYDACQPGWPEAKPYIMLSAGDKYDLKNRRPIRKKMLPSPAFGAAIEEFEQTVERTVQRNGIGGAAAGVVLDGQVVWKKGFGWRDIEKKIPADANGVYRVGSITKSFTAMAMVQLAEKGIFALDEPVYQHFPEIEALAGKTEYAKLITFRHLASHTAGLAKEPQSKDAASGPIAEWEDKILASIPKTKIPTRPGQCHRYSNIGFGILGLAVSRAANEPYMNLIKKLILEPLDMKHSGFVLTEEMKSLLAAGIHAGIDGTLDTQIPQREHIGRGYKVPNGGLYTTIDDLARFITLHTDCGPAGVISSGALAQMHRIQVATDEKDFGCFEKAYGLGLRIHTAPDGVCLVGHFGSVSGYDSTMCFHPETKIGVILLRSYLDAKAKDELRLRTVNLLRALVALRKKNAGTSMDFGPQRNEELVLELFLNADFRRRSSALILEAT